MAVGDIALKPVRAISPTRSDRIFCKPKDALPFLSVATLTLALDKRIRKSKNIGELKYTRLTNFDFIAILDHQSLNRAIQMILILLASRFFASAVFNLHT